MTYQSRLMSGIIIVTIPTIAFGGYFLLEILSGEAEAMALTDFQKSMFRAGHAHAGVLVILALIAQLLVDQMKSSNTIKWFVRAGFPAGALLISGGFFAAATGSNIHSPTSGIYILYFGIAVLLLAIALLGAGLIRNKEGK